jgi:hypothetical protein
VREDHEVSETRSHVVASSEHKEEEWSRVWESDDGDEDNGDKDEVTTFDSVCCSSLSGFLLEERKNDFIVPNLSRFVFRDCLSVARKEKKSDFKLKFMDNR